MRFHAAEGGFLPTRGTVDAAGWDLRTPYTITLMPGELLLVKLAIMSALPPGQVAIMKEKSGLALKGLEVHGGVIDSDYRGEWGVILRNGGSEKLFFAAGDKIAQFILVNYSSEPLIQVSVEELGTTSRGAGAYGSTGR